jgi:multiple sugar transport system permease protein
VTSVPETAPAAAPAPKRRRRVRAIRQRGEGWLGWALCLPLIVVLGLFVFYPLLLGLQMSTQSLDYNTGATGQFIGFRNYVNVITDPETHAAALHTIGYVVIAVAVELVLGLAFALALRRPFRGRGAVLALLILPWALPPVVAGLLWSHILDPGTGLLNSALYQMGIIGHYHAWLNNQWTAIVAISFVHAWSVVPLVTLILLAGLQGVPDDIYAAASVDGASAAVQFRRLTLPLLRPAIAIALTNGTIAAFSIFDQIYVLNGEALSTRSIMTQVYLTGFTNLNFGLGTALAWLLTLVTAIAGIAYIRSLSRAR